MKQLLIVVALVALSAVVTTALPPPHRRVRGEPLDIPEVSWIFSSWISGPPCPARELAPVPLDFAASPLLSEAVANLTARVEAIAAMYTAYGFNLSVHGAVTYRGDVVFSHGAGRVSADENATVPTADTIYSTGSVTKVFATLLLAMMAEEGTVSFDDPVSMFFPGFAPPDPYKTGRHVTIGMLASHTSGLGREPACSIYNTCGLTEEEIIAYASSVPLLYPPGTTPHYSNLATGLLGRCLERADGRGKTFEQLVTERILEPLNMSSTGFEYSDAVRARMAVGYTISASPFLQVPNPFWATTMGWATAAGGMYTTTADMARFLAHVTTPGAVPPHWMDLATPQPSAVDGFGAGALEMAFANGYWTFTKSGLVGGFASSIAFVPSLRLGAVFWLNAMDALPNTATAVIMRDLIPPLLHELRAAQSPFELPPAGTFEKYLGTHLAGYATILEDSNTNTSGLFVGQSMLGATTWYWDKVQSELYAKRLGSNGTDAIAFRARTPPSSTTSCFIIAAGGDGAVLFFHTTAANETVASMPDQMFYEEIETTSSSGNGGGGGVGDESSSDSLNVAALNCASATIIGAIAAAISLFK